MADYGKLLLFVGYIAALGLGAYELQRAPAMVPPPSGQTVRNLPALDLPTTVIKNVAAYDAITERPLFVRDRRPHEQPEQDGVAVAGPSDSIDGVRLTAVLSDGSSMIALLEDRSGKTQTLRPGDEFGSWRLEEILDDSVVVVSDSGKKTLLVHQFDAARTTRNTRRVPRAATRRVTPRPTRPPTTRSSTAGRTPAGTAQKP